MGKKFVKKSKLSSLKQFGFSEAERDCIADYLEKRDEKLSQLIRRLVKKEVEGICHE